MPIVEPPAPGMRWETTSEHIARDMDEGRFPDKSERKQVPDTMGASDEEQAEEERIDALRLTAFRTNDTTDRQAYFDAVSKWFQDRHYRRIAAPSYPTVGELEVVAWQCTRRTDHGPETTLSAHPITDGDRSLGWRDEPLVTLSAAQSSIQRAERERDEARLREGALIRDCEVYKGHAADQLERALTAEAQLAEARKVLEPFAELMFTGSVYENASDDTAVLVCHADGSKVCVGDFLVARDALNSMKETDHDGQ